MGWSVGVRRVVAAMAVGAVTVVVPVIAEATRGPQAAAASTALVWGQAYGPRNARVSVSVALFTSGWVYLRAVRSTAGGVFRISGVAPGRYWLQVTDLRKTWNIKKLARTDAAVVVAAGQAGVQRDVSMRRGAFITGKVSLGKHRKRAARATVKAVSQYGATYETTADGAGSFALGGLPGNQGYSVFFYDRKAHWTGKSRWIRKLKVGKGRNLAARLKTRAGGYIGVLTINGLPATGIIWGTVVNTKTGQFWVEPIVNGDLSRFRGLAPGAYRLELTDNGTVLTQTIPLPVVHAGRVSRAHAAAASYAAPAAPTATPTATVSATSTASATPTDTASSELSATSATAPSTASATATEPTVPTP